MIALTNTVYKLFDSLIWFLKRCFIKNNTIVKKF